MIDIALEKAVSEKVDNVSFQNQSIDGLKVENESFDVVMGNSILHLLDNRLDVLAKIHKILKSDGIFVSSTMCIGDSLKLKLMMPFMTIGRYFGLLPSINAFTTKDLLNELCKAGFKIKYDWQPKKNSAIFIIANKI